MTDDVRDALYKTLLTNFAYSDNDPAVLELVNAILANFDVRPKGKNND